MTNSLVALLFIILITGNVHAQAGTQKPCSAPECGQFDFWLGHWKLTYNDTMRAANNITKEMDGCMVHERFHDPRNNYNGESWSVYSVQRKKWQQTWVDNQGSYIALTGEFKDGKMILLTEPALQPDGKTKQNRMIYYHITANSFDWDWEATTDAGKTWTNLWHIHYSRI